MPDSMHILFLQFYSSSPAPDLHEMALALRTWGHTVWVATPDAAGDLEWSDGKQIVAVQRGPRRIPSWVARIRPLAMVALRFVSLGFMIRVRGFVRQSGARIVQLNPPLYAWVVPVFMPRRMYFVLDVRQAGEVGGGGLRGSFKNWKSITSLRINSRWFYDHACFATEAAARRVLGERWQRWATVHRVGQHAQFLSYTWNEQPGEAGDNRLVRFVYIGTLSRTRRLERVFSAVRWLMERRKDFRVDFVGPDEAQGFYHRLVNEMNLSSVLELKPPVPYEQVASVVATYDVAVAYVPPLPDWQYQPTLKVLEYRALGMPIIASDNEPNRDVVRDGTNGVLVNDTVESIGHAMLRFIEDRAFLRHCKQEARLMRRGQTWTDVAKRYEEVVYRRVME